MYAPSTACVVLVLAVLPAWIGGRAPQTPRGVNELAAALNAADPVARARAACDLREHGDSAAAAIDQLAALLADGAPVDHSVCARRWWPGNGDHETTPGELAAATLVSIGSRAYPALERALASTAWIARRNAAWALGALDEPRAVRGLIAALRDREAPVREQAAWALGAIDQRDAAEPLIATLKDSDARVRRQAAWALGALDEPRAAHGLIDALRDSDAPVREQAAWALGVIDRQEAVTPLIAALKDDDARVRRQAAWALGVITR